MTQPPGETMAEFGTPGFFGKLPSRGDFVSRRLPSSFLGTWDDWLQMGLSSSRERLGERWLDTYLTSPIWQFALSTGVCGSEGYVGVMIPSVDRVGRYFPLTAAMPCAGSTPILQIVRGLEGWFTHACDLLLGTLAEEPLELEAFDDRLSGAIPKTEVGDLEPASPWPWTESGPGTCWHLGVPAGLDTAASGNVFLSTCLESALGAYSLWWTAGSDRVEPSFLIVSGLPDAAAFVAMLAGGWSESGWSSGTLRGPPARVSRAPASPAGPPLAVPANLRAWSAGFSDTGKVRDRNEDAFACRDDFGAWIVADGLGGHQAGEIASRMVVSVIDELAAGENLGERLSRLDDSVRVVNRCLKIVADRDDKIALTGSTIAALLLDQDGAGACIWAGDSRVYRLRRGVLAQLSRDHSEASEMSVENGQELALSNGVVTRAVGGDDEIELDVQFEDTQPGDRFLLCSDGLYGEVTEDVLVDALSAADPQNACTRLREAVLLGNAPDNLTGVVVFVDTVTTHDPIGTVGHENA